MGNWGFGIRGQMTQEARFLCVADRLRFAVVGTPASEVRRSSDRGVQ